MSGCDRTLNSNGLLAIPRSRYQKSAWDTPQRTLEVEFIILHRLRGGYSGEVRDGDGEAKHLRAAVAEMWILIV